MKTWMVALIVVLVCIGVYWPQKNAGFVLDDYYTIVRNPLIKNVSLYKDIWTSRLFDAHQSSGYIKFGYYRPVLQSSWILDYRLFALNACGYQWVNLLIHALNCIFIYILFVQLFANNALALKTCLLFSLLPTQEWVVRYVTGRGDELSVLFALLSLLSLLQVIKGQRPFIICVLIFWVLAALTREIAISYILYAVILWNAYSKDKDIGRFSLYWVGIGILPLVMLWPIIPKQGNILVMHIFYFTSVGFCLWLAQFCFRWVIVLLLVFACVSSYQGRFWTTEEVLLRHTRNLEWWPRTVVDQQLLMKYDEDIPGIKDMVDRTHDPLRKAMWLRRLGIVYFSHKDLSKAQEYFTQALTIDPSNVDTLNAIAVVYLQEGQEAKGLEELTLSAQINPSYPDTLRTLGIYYYIHKDYLKARMFLTRCLSFDPYNHQAQELLRLAKAAN